MDRSATPVRTAKELVNRFRVRLLVLTLPVSGVLFALTALVPGIDINPATDPAGFARNAELIGTANIVGMVGLVLLLIGFQALHGILASTPASRSSFFGLVLSTVGIGLYLPFIGIFAFAVPAAGRLYLNGEQSAVTVIADATNASNPYILIAGGFSLLSYLLGSALFAVAIWRSRRLPKWPAIPYALVPLGAIPIYNSTLFFLGGLFLLSAGLEITRKAWYTSASPG